MNPAVGTALRRQPLELTIFHDVAKALTSTLEIGTILQTIMDKMAEYYQPETWTLLMVDEKAGEMTVAIAQGDAVNSLGDVRIKVGDGVAGWVARHGKPLLVRDVARDAAFLHESGESLPPGTNSLLCMPLCSRDRVLGVIQLVNVQVEGLGEVELYFLQTLCEYAAIAIENARAVSQIQELTITDDCTSLFNARHLHNVLDAEVYRSKRFSYEFALVFLDLDYFKQVNDNFGHLAGSRVLAEAGGLIRKQLRLIDYAFRYGGDEFVVLLPQSGKDAAISVARRLRESIREHSFCAEMGLNIRVHASFGVASYPDDATTARDMVRRADEMMYLVKKTTRDNIAAAQRGVVE